MIKLIEPSKSNPYKPPLSYRLRLYRKQRCQNSLFPRESLFRSFLEMSHHMQMSHRMIHRQQRRLWRVLRNRPDTCPCVLLPSSRHQRRKRTHPRTMELNFISILKRYLTLWVGLFLPSASENDRVYVTVISFSNIYKRSSCFFSQIVRGYEEKADPTDWSYRIKSARFYLTPQFACSSLFLKGW